MEKMKNSQIKVSVIVPAYNEEKYLERCLKTVVNQSLNEMEVIIVDDGSSDGTYDISEKYHEEYPEKVIVIHKQNEGLGPARNSGIEIARGEYIGFVDADDWVETNMYESMYRTARKFNSDVVVCDVKKVFVSDHNKEMVEISLPEESGNIDIGKYIKEGLNPAYSWNKLYRREIWEKYKFKKMVYEDLDIILTILSHCKTVSYVQQPFNTYFKRPNSITTSYTNIRLMDIMQAYRDAANNANRKYKEETVFCVAKRILINMKTPGLAYYMADFIELINELMGLFETNAYIKENETVSEILKFKGQKTISKNIYFIGSNDEERRLDRFIKEYKIVKRIRSVDDDSVLLETMKEICDKGGILVNLEEPFEIPIGRLRTEGCFLVTKHDKAVLIGAQAGHEILKKLYDGYRTEVSFIENVGCVLNEYQGTSFESNGYRVIIYK